MLPLSTSDFWRTLNSVAVKVRRKPKGAYHHPDLERALVDAAVRTIREQGVDALTLRDVGAQLGVSRTALYRHFADKSALLARVACEGFRIFRGALQSALKSATEQGKDPLEEMGKAYIGFALSNQSHYLTMFSSDFGGWEQYPELIAEAGSAYNLLLTCVEQHPSYANGKAGPRYNPPQLANLAWATCHGIATLGMAGHFGTNCVEPGDLADLVQLYSEIMRSGLRA